MLNSGTYDSSNLFDFSRTELEAFFQAMGEKPYRAQQILQWVHQKGCVDFAQMSNLSAKLRERLISEAQLLVPEVSLEKKSQDGTYKWLMRLADGNAVETVFIPEGERINHL